MFFRVLLGMDYRSNNWKNPDVPLTNNSFKNVIYTSFTID